MALAGASNVVPPGRGAFVVMKAEDVAALQPAVVILADPAAAENSPLRSALPATTRFLVDPGLPISWIENPPSLNRFVGALWLASKLTPDKIRFTEDDASKLIGALFHAAPESALLDRIMDERR
jgi:iron complex transport system substrate-binding protein